MNLICQYPRRCDILSPDLELKQAELLLQYEIPHINYESNSSANSRCSSAVVGSPISSPGVPTSQPAHNLLSDDRHPNSLLQSQTSQILTPIKSTLLNHYLEHTSKDMTVDEEDQYTLQVGIPNLAFQNKVLMKSILAFSAVCKCCDIINQPPISHGDRGRVVVLLSIAEQYHMESLREIQATLAETDQYDHILANAAIMGMYGSSSHRVRIWLAETASDDDLERGRFMPKSCQWISLFRAVRVAYTGLLNDRFKTEDIVQLAPVMSPIHPVSSCDFQIYCECKVTSWGEQAMSPQDHALYPILAATVVPAVKELRRRAEEIVRSGMGGYQEGDIPAIHNDSDVQACFAALELFENIASETFPGEKLMSNVPAHSSLASEVDISPVGQVSKVSPWMRRYTARITSIIPSNLPRRFIVAFVHKAPTKYLNLVEDMMDLMKSGAPRGHEITSCPLNPMNSEPSRAHQLALDIFAHWLVLVMLLDKVWWIGGIGAWELGQLISLRQNMRWCMSLWKKDEDWWPGSMFEISRQFNKHRAKD
ncbi:hypothetical protein N7537_006850 [Penicillium hordei]|uniref:Uncharacterized protein n=1 Tax=Penicillium hordei TaxID=40994 RepID=A0AAD6H5K7_9EURO|nr:uncharacterized protein N7537_006850 [Penicillium hordei]KAJ5603894.1 hypothetical protein N7537_006850 [Penicillium hordei]